MENKSEFHEIERKFSQFFKLSKFTTAYKPIVLKSILYLTHLTPKEHAISDPESNQLYYFIDINEICKYFIRFNFTLHKIYHLRQIADSNVRADIYNIIDTLVIPKEIQDQWNINKFNKIIPSDAIHSTKELLFRHVIYFLRKDVHIYDFYTNAYQKIDIPLNIKSEGDFRKIIKNLNVSTDDFQYIGMNESVVNFINRTFPVLNAAIISRLSIFLEKQNNLPNLGLKIAAIDEPNIIKRNIPNWQKEKIYKFQNNICFYCGHDMSKDAAADHFIPFHFLGLSNVWNIVGACASCNSKKSDYLVQKTYLERLKQRNLDPNFRYVMKDPNKKNDISNDISDEDGDESEIENGLPQDIKDINDIESNSEPNNMQNYNELGILKNKELDEYYTNCSFYFKLKDM